MYSIKAPKKEYINNDLLESYIEGMKQKDKESLVNFYESTKNDVYSYILSIIIDKHDAEDIFQEVYVKVYEASDTYQAYGKPLAWVITIAKNMCYMKLRKKKDTVDITEMYDLKIEDNTSNTVENIEILNAAFKHISKEDRSIIVLHVIAGLKHKEIAKLLELPLSTCLSRYHRAIKKLQKILKEDIK